MANEPTGRWAVKPEAQFLDLRDVGRPDSRSPVPGWVYGLQLLPTDERGNPDTTRTAVEPQPFCHFRLARAGRDTAW